MTNSFNPGLSMFRQSTMIRTSQLLTHNDEQMNANVFSIVSGDFSFNNFSRETTKHFFFSQILDRFQKSVGDPFFVFLLFSDSAVLLRSLVKFLEQL